MADYATYASLTELKNRLGITGTGDDAQFLLLLVASSRKVDAHCGRHFYAKAATRYYDGENGLGYVVDQYTERLTQYVSKLWVDDLLSVTSIKLDEDGDAVWEETLVVTDYILWPYIEFPKLRVDLDLRQGNFSSWPKGQQAVEAVGVWGYGDGKNSATPYEDSGTNTNEVMDATETGLDVASGTLFSVGNTILVESEQMYVTAIAANTLTVVRGVNGTTAATHATDKDVYICRYPEAVREAVLMQAARLWARRDSKYATVIGGPEVGTLEVHRGLDADVKDFLKPFVKTGIGYLGALA